VDQWLARDAKQVSTRTLQELRSILKRSIARAQARDKVKRNVVLLCELPKGRPGRPSMSLTLDQAVAVLDAADTAKAWLRAYITLSLLTGARTEELRGLTWAHLVAFDTNRNTWAPVREAGWAHEEFAIYVWRSVRRGGDTKTVKSRRMLELPQRCVVALRSLREQQVITRKAVGSQWQDNDLVFATRTGTGLRAGNVQREFCRVIVKAGLHGATWLGGCGRASCRCCPTAACRSSRSPGWWDMPAPRLRNRCTGSRSARSSRTARSQWIGSSLMRAPRHSRPVGHSSNAKGRVLDRIRPLSWVGDTGFEPVTSSV
jgi:integrase